jgi:hypothetical protein
MGNHIFFSMQSVWGSVDREDQSSRKTGGRKDWEDERRRGKEEIKLPTEAGEQGSGVQEGLNNENDSQTS